MCQRNIGDIDGACAYYEKSTSKNPLDADAWIDLANISLKMGKKKLATEKFREGLRFDWISPDKLQAARQSMVSLGEEFPPAGTKHEDHLES